MRALERIRYALYSCSILLFAALGACNHMDLDGPTGELMLVNMNRSLEGAVTFSFNGLKANTSAVGYGANSGYISVKNGDYAMEVLNGEDVSVYSQNNLPIRSGEHYSFIMFGQDELKTLLLDDQFQTSEGAHIRFFNFVEDLPELSLVAVTDSTINPIFEDRAFETTQTAKNHAGFEEFSTGSLSITLMEQVPDETEIPPEPEDPSPEDPENPEPEDPTDPGQEDVDPGNVEEEEPVDRGFLLDPQKIDLKAKGHYTIIASGQTGSAEYPIKVTVIKNK